MTNVTLSNAIKDQILDGLLKNSVLETSFGRHFLKFDRLTIRQHGISFGFGREEVFYLDFPAGFNIGTDVFKIDGIEGRMKCSIQT